MLSQQDEADPHALAGHERPVVSGPRLAIAVQLIVLAIFGGALLLALLVIPGLVGLATATNSTPAPASPAADAPFRVTDQQWAGLRVQRADTELFRPISDTDGKIALDDDRTTPVFSPYSGRVTKVIAHAGDVVAQGAPLFAIEASELSQAENDIVSAVATQRTARAQLDLATANEVRQHTLYLGHGAALKDWQQSRVDLATAQGGLRSAEIAVAAVRNRLLILGESPVQIRALEAATNLPGERAETIVRAPIGGTITQRQIGPGQNIVGASASAGAASPVFSIGDLTKMWLVANARETDAPFIHVGDPVKVSVLAYPGRVFDARVVYVAAGIDPNTHRLAVRAEIDNPDGALKPEMFATFEIVTGTGESAPGVPDDAVVYEGADAHVWVADPANKTLALRAIKVGHVYRGMVEVLGGLKPGESVVTSGSVFIDRAIAGG